VLKTLVGLATIVTWYIREAVSEDVVVGPVREFGRRSEPSVAFVEVAVLGIIHMILDEATIWSAKWATGALCIANPIARP